MQSTRRSALPLRVHHIWDGIVQANTGTPGPVDYERLMAILASEYKLPQDELNRELNLAIKDQLVIVDVIQTQRRQDTEIYMLPDPEFSKGDHDWYCFKCHLGGDGAVVACEDCPRIFHLDCLPAERKPQKDLFVCPSCHIMATMPSVEQLNLKQEQLNKLLEYSCSRFKKWLIPFMNSCDGKAWAVTSSRDAKEAWRYDYLVYFQIDLTQMLEKATNGKYTSLEEYQVDCETLVHGIGVYFGIDQAVAAAFHSEVMHDIQEIKLCHDCFRRSTEKDHDWWFCLPCTIPHEVVWAKQSGYPYWPAKVRKIEGSKYDVRYFGGNYKTSIIDVKNIQPISTPLANLRIRPTDDWNEAFEELQKFQEIARNPELVSSLPTTKDDSFDILDILDAEDVSFLNSLEDAFDEDSLNEETCFSDEEKDEFLDKVSEDAAPSSVNESSSNRNVYVQSNNGGNNAQHEAIKESVVKHLASMKERHAREISVTKKKQWCFNCEREAMYHCCWNTAYCSVECQKAHWTKEHKRLCRRNKKAAN